MVKVAPSILAANPLELGKAVAAAETGGADWLHIDIMDGHFVPNLSYGPDLVRNIKKICRLPLDVHLMLDEPARYVSTFLESGADIVTVHQEVLTVSAFTALAQHVHDAGRKIGIAINPPTEGAAILPYLESADMALVMTVNPGFGGQSFIPETIEKMKTIHTIAPQLELEVDGGIHAGTAPDTIRAGASVLVAGSSVFGAESIPKAIEALKGQAILS